MDNKKNKNKIRKIITTGINRIEDVILLLNKVDFKTSSNSGKSLSGNHAELDTIHLFWLDFPTV